MMKILAAALLSLASVHANAVEYAYIPDASKLMWQLQGGKVFLRNLNEFKSSFLPCCYNYSIDTTTPDGKVQWATLLARITAGQSIYVGVNDPAQVSAIAYIGIW